MASFQYVAEPVRPDWEASLLAMPKDELIREIRYQRTKLRALEGAYSYRFPLEQKPRQMAGALTLPEAKETPDLRTLLLDYLVSLNGKPVSVREIMRHGPGRLRHTPAHELTSELNALASTGMLQKEIQPGKIAPRFFLTSEAGE